MIYIYLKAHNITGLKYLGKTKGNPYSYNGSGKYWKRHIKKYGFNITTEILFQSENLEEIKKEGIRLSKELNVVESEEFANLKAEEGDGGFGHIWKMIKSDPEYRKEFCNKNIYWIKKGS